MKLYTKLSTKLGLAILLATSAAAHASVTLVTPEEIPVLALDDQEVSYNLLRGAFTQYKLDAGQHNISVRYEQLFEHRNGEHDIVKSGVVTIPVTLQDNQTYKLKLVPAPQDYYAGKDFADKPTIAIVDNAGHVVAQQTGVNNKPKSWLGGGIFGKTFDYTSDRQQAVQQNIAAKKAQDAAALPVVAGASTATLDQLKQLWQQATPAERQQFAGWMVGQSH